MAKKKNKPEDGGPSKAYLLSFGDTMTTLLAFFIVLNSLAEDQSGANLHSGTGSFMQAMNSFGTEGVFNKQYSTNAVAQEHSKPLYIAEMPSDKEPERGAEGPDPDDNDVRVIDREAEEFQRFIQEMERLARVSETPRVAGEVTFDFFEPLNQQSPYLPSAYSSVLTKVLPLLRQPGYRVELIVWAGSPAVTAWKRAAATAREVNDEIVTKARLTAEQEPRLSSYGRTWPYSDVRRPVLSVITRKVSAPDN